MEELELLKKDWKKSGDDYPQLSYDDIYKLIHKKSSSIVKWIFIICIAEFIFWAGINLLVPDSTYAIYERFNLKTFLHVVQVIHYAIIVVFIVLFYRNHRAISVFENTHMLMQKIIKTRKTVNYYVYYNILLYIVLSIILNVIMFSQPDLLMEVMNPDSVKIESERFFKILLVAQIIAFVVICGLLWLYYRIIYGILLKKLMKNYKELGKLKPA
jgi:hypothetical protein